MNNNDQTTTDANKQSVTLAMLIIVGFIDLVLFVFWTAYTLRLCNGRELFIQGFPDMIASLTALTVAILGVNIVNKGVFSKGGTKYYPNKYGYRKLKNILNSYNYESNYHEVNECVKNTLLVSRENDEFNCLYFDYVYSLQQENDLDFEKVWNDYNYYKAKSRPTEKEADYIKKLEKYIFTRVYEKHISERNI